VTVALAVAGGALTVLAGALFYGADPGVLAVLPLGAVAWASLGTAVSGLVPSVEAAWPVIAVTYVPAVLLSGRVAEYMPAAPLADGALSARDVAVLAAWTALGAALSLRRFSWLPRRR
jgi:ABC-2 type transport system permease protein